MLNSDFKAVEAVILQRIARIRKAYEKTHSNSNMWTDAVHANFNASIEPLRESLKALRENYYKE